MSEQKQWQGLIDFSELRRKKDEYNTSSSKLSGSNQGIDFDLDSNQQIIKSFKDLRQKLKNALKENNLLRDEIGGLTRQIKQLQDSEKLLQEHNHQSKAKIVNLQQVLDEWKKRFTLLKEQVADYQALGRETDLLKQVLVNQKAKSNMLQDEKRKLIQISVEQKMILEEKLNRIQSQRHNQQKYLVQTEAELQRMKESNLKLENTLKKLEIKYEEELFNKKWNQDCFQKDYLQKKIIQLEAQLSDRKSKSRKEKEKRIQLQQRLLQLEETVGLCSVKAESYEGQTQIMSKKIKKLECKVSQAKNNMQKFADQRIMWEEKFNKSVNICDQLIARVKRQLVGDMVELAKACQFKLNKLKQLKESGFNKINGERASTPHKKGRTQKKVRNSVQKQIKISKTNQNITNQILDQQNILSETDTNRQKFQSTVKKQQQINRGSFDKIQLSQDFGNVEQKVRRERQQMERKLKERMLFRKIELSSSPSKAKMREQYLKILNQR